ncbi:MAG: flagellar FliL protein [Halothiobacillaceae bacterium]|nr:MAG: flagellar FliL protein [Halothiobacillaceae bacterium]
MATSDAKENELEEPSPGVAKKDRSGVIKAALIGLGVVALMGMNAGITWMLTRSNVHPSAPTPAPAAGAESPQGDEAASEEAPTGEGVNLPAYYKFDPPFIVNFQAQDSLRFLQVTVEVVSKDPAVIKAIETHMPVIRNNLVMLFSNQDFNTISSRVGKERIRAQVLAEIQKILREKINKPGVDEVYFTSFVMQ